MISWNYFYFYHHITMKQCPSETRSCSVGREIAHFLWKAKLHHRVRKNPPLVPILSELNAAHPVLLSAELMAILSDISACDWSPESPQPSQLMVLKLNVSVMKLLWYVLSVHSHLTPTGILSLDFSVYASAMNWRPMIAIWAVSKERNLHIMTGW